MCERNDFSCFRISSNREQQEHKGITSYDGNPHVQTVFVPHNDETRKLQVTFADSDFIAGQKIYKKLNDSGGN